MVLRERRAPALRPSAVGSGEPVLAGRGRPDCPRVRPPAGPPGLCLPSTRVSAGDVGLRPRHSAVRCEQGFGAAARTAGHRRVVTPGTPGHARCPVSQTRSLGPAQVRTLAQDTHGRGLASVACRLCSERVAGCGARTGPWAGGDAAAAGGRPSRPAAPPDPLCPTLPLPPDGQGGLLHRGKGFPGAGPGWLCVLLRDPSRVLRSAALSPLSSLRSSPRPPPSRSAPVPAHLPVRPSPS